MNYINKNYLNEKLLGVVELFYFSNYFLHPTGRRSIFVLFQMMIKNHLKSKLKIVLLLKTC